MIMRLGGGTPKKLLETGIIRSGASHPDNRRIVMTTAEASSEVWVIEGLTRK